MIAVLLVLLALLGMPLFAVIAGGALAAAMDQQLDPTLVILEFLRVAEMELLLALPFFTFAGVVLGQSRTPGRLVELAERILSPVPGAPGLGLLLAGTFVAAMGGLTAGLVLAGTGAAIGAVGKPGPYGRLGPGYLLAPSAALILFAVLVREVAPAGRVTLDQVFLAGLIPAILAVGLFSFQAIRKQGEGEARAAQGVLPGDGDWNPGRALWDLSLPLIVLGAVFSGFPGLVETAALAVVWVIVSVCLVRREVALSHLPALAGRAMIPCGAVLILLGLGLFTSNYLVDTGTPGIIHGWLDSWLNGTGFLLIGALVLVLMGAVAGMMGGLILLAPLAVPLALAFEIHPLQFAIAFVLSLQIGAGIADPGPGKPARQSVSLVACLAVVLVLVVFFPGLTTAWTGSDFPWRSLNPGY